MHTCARPSRRGPQVVLEPIPACIGNTPWTGRQSTQLIPMVEFSYLDSSISLACMSLD
uniref:Uncharacterized protein n=1 Tax=Anguilla anguilla TaxID=7936 RepID=A0A0E9S1K6_ANGAN